MMLPTIDISDPERTKMENLGYDFAGLQVYAESIGAVELVHDFINKQWHLHDKDGNCIDCLPIELD